MLDWYLNNKPDPICAATRLIKLALASRSISILFQFIPN